jgi:hypothetical protein
VYRDGIDGVEAEQEEGDIIITREAPETDTANANQEATEDDGEADSKEAPNFAHVRGIVMNLRTAHLMPAIETKLPV